MKYSEFLQLSEILESQGTTVSKEFKLNEANEDPGEQIETEKGGLFTKWGRIKTTLNKNAKKLQDQIIKQVIEKYLPNILKVERNVTETLQQAIQQNKKGEELKKILMDKVNVTSKIQRRQLEAVYNYVDKTLNNADVTFDKKINTAESSKTITQILDVTTAFFKGGKDTAVLKLKNYWQLLHTQIQMNAYNYITRAIENDAKKILGNNDQVINAYYKVSTTKKINQQRVKTINDRFAEYRKAQEESEKQAHQPTPEIGKKYKYNDYEGILNKDEDGEYVLQVAPGQKIVIPKDRIYKLSLIEPTQTQKTSSQDVAGGEVEAKAE